MRLTCPVGHNGLPFILGETGGPLPTRGLTPVDIPRSVFRTSACFLS